MTSDITYLPQVDQIFFMDEGSVVESGNYYELVALDGPFAKYLRSQITFLEEHEASKRHYKNYEQRGTTPSGRALAWCAGGGGFNSWLGHTKDFEYGIDASLLSTRLLQVRSRKYGRFSHCRL